MRAETQPVVSIIIVNFNAGPLLTEAVRGALASPVPLEVFVVDNGSTDGSLALLKSVAGTDRRLRIIANGRNLGFTRANNIALKQASGDFVLLLNPDCIISSDTLPKMLKAMAAHPEAGMAGCLLRNPDGTEQAGCRRSVPTPWRTLVRVLHLDKLFPKHPRFRNFILAKQPLPTKPTYLEAISGAFMLVTREALSGVGLMDEGYFLHCDDLDWCMRFRKAGWQILFVPDVEAVHYQGTCCRGRPMRVLWHKHKGMVRYYRKFFRHQYPAPLMWAVTAAVWARFGLLGLATLVTWARGRGDLEAPTPVLQPGIRLASTTHRNTTDYTRATPPVSGLRPAPMRERRRPVAHP